MGLGKVLCRLPRYGSQACSVGQGRERLRPCQKLLDSDSRVRTLPDDRESVKSEFN